MVRSRAPIRYIIQSGVIGACAGAGVGVVIGGSTGVGGSCGSGGGTDGVAGSSGITTGGIAGGAGSNGSGSVGGDFVVKALTALQALRVLELIAITFQ